MFVRAVRGREAACRAYCRRVNHDVYGDNQRKTIAKAIACVRRPLAVWYGARSLTRTVPANPETVTALITDVEPFMLAAGFDEVTLDGDNLGIMNRVGLFEIELDLEIVETDAVLRYEQRQGIFESMITETRSRPSTLGPKSGDDRVSRTRPPGARRGSIDRRFRRASRTVKQSTRPSPVSLTR